MTFEPKKHLSGFAAVGLWYSSFFPFQCYLFIKISYLKIKTSLFELIDVTRPYVLINELIYYLRIKHK